MAKTKKPKTRNILVRDINKETAERLDQFKSEHRWINADSKVVIHMIQNWESEQIKYKKLEAELYRIRERSSQLFNIVDSMREARKAQDEFWKDEKEEEEMY